MKNSSINAIRCVHVASKSALNYRNYFASCMKGRDCDHMYVSACRVIILYFASLRTGRTLKHILLHVSSWGCYAYKMYWKEKRNRLEIWAPQGSKTSLIQTLHVIMLCMEASFSSLLDNWFSSLVALFRSSSDVLSCGGYCARWPLMCCKKIL